MMSARLTRNASRLVADGIRHRLKWLCLFAPACLLILDGCEEEREPPVTISVKLFPARLVEDPTAEPEAGWRLVEYGGSVRAGAGTYLVAPEPIMTEWNISAFKTAFQPDGSAAVTARLNAYGRRKVSEFTGDPANLKKHLATEIDGRWADIRPLLRKISDRVTLYGFTPEEAERLERYLATR